MTSFVKFVRDEDEKDEIVLDVINHKGLDVGQIYKVKVGRKERYCFLPYSDTWFTWECLKEIMKKLISLGVQEREKL